MTMSAPTRELPRMLARYREDIAPALQSEFGYDNVMQIPRPDEDRRQHGRRRGHP